LTSLTSPTELQNFFYNTLGPVADEDEAEDVGLSYGRLSAVFSQDGFYTFSDPEVTVTTNNDGSITVTGDVTVAPRTGTGRLDYEVDFDPNGFLDNISETRTFRPGVRPICQATKLLDKDPLVRRMAEQAILTMGASCKDYLKEQHAKAKAQPELQHAIDRLWKRILCEGW
jgi:hypothetical protein